MIQSVKITNHKNESIEMILTRPETSEFIIGEGGIDGLGPEQTNINSTDNQIYDGASYDSAVTGVKNIVFHLLFDPVDGNVERVRHKCYKYFPTKELIKIEIYTDERSLYIEGYVESNLPTIFEEREGADISILCMDPYFKSNTKYSSIIRGNDSAFVFPFCNNSIEPVLLMGLIKTDAEQDIVYFGEIETGVEMIIRFSGNISGKIIIENNNINNSQSMIIDMDKIKEQHHISISDNAYLLLNTSTGSKNIKLYNNGEEYDATIGLGIANLNWIRLNHGINHISISDSPYIEGFELNNDIIYGGV